MNTIVYASIKARIAGVDLLNTGLLSASFSHRVNVTDILSNSELPSSTNKLSLPDGKSLFHKKVKTIYAHAPQSIRTIVDAICKDVVCDLLKVQLRTLYEINPQSRSITDSTILNAEDFISPLFIPKYVKSIVSTTNFSELESIIRDIFELQEFTFSDNGNCRFHEEQIDQLYYNKIFSTLRKYSYLCRRQMTFLYRLKVSKSKTITDQRAEYYQLDSTPNLVPPFGLFEKKQTLREINKYIKILTKTLRRSPITPLPIFAYILMLEVWCNRAAGLLSRTQVEPRMTAL